MIFEMFELHNPFYWDFTCPEFPAGVLYGLKLSRETGTYSTKVYLAQLAQRSSSWVISVPIFCLFPQSPLRTSWYPTSWLFALFFSHLKHIAGSVCDVEMGSRTQFWGYPGNQTWQWGKKAGMVFGMNACPHLCNGFPTRASRSLGQRSKSYVIRPRAGHQFNWKISIISGWWFQPTPLKNDGVKVSWDDEKFPWKFP